MTGNTLAAAGFLEGVSGVSGSAPWMGFLLQAGDGSSIGLTNYLVASAVVFGVGVMVVVTRRNAIAVLMGIELMINAAGLNFVAFARYSAPETLDGQVVTLFAIVIAAAEAALALAIALNIFNNLNTVQVDEARNLKG